MPKPSQDPAGKSGGFKIKVLHVDDAEDILSYSRIILNGVGMEVLSASTAKAGIELAEKQHPDIILMDVELPDMDGARASWVLKQNPKTKDIPIIMLTVKDDDKDIRKALNFGAAEYIVKPFQKDNLIARILEVLKQSRKKT